MIVRSGILHFFGKAWVRSYDLFASQVSIGNMHSLSVETKNVVIGSQYYKNITRECLFVQCGGMNVRNYI